MSTIFLVFYKLAVLPSVNHARHHSHYGREPYRYAVNGTQHGSGQTCEQVKADVSEHIAQQSEACHS